MSVTTSLGIGDRVPDFTLTDADGNRLAKRHDAPTLADLRASGLAGPELADMLRAGHLPLGFGLAKA